jgi:cell division protein FtsL
MPVASASYAPSRRRASARAGARRSASLRAAGRVRWDRLGRIAMLFVLLALVFLYMDTGMRMFSTWRQSQHTSARVTAMEREHRQLLLEHKRLSSQANLEDQAKALGMQRPDEQTYIVGNLPND